MRIEFTTQAIEALDNIAKYIRDNYGRRYAEKFQTRMSKCLNRISNYPESSPIEQLLADRPLYYHGLIVNDKNKIVYRIDGDIIYIVDIWDMRQHPDKLKHRIK